MKNLTNKLNLGTAAIEVQAKFAAALESLAGLKELAEIVQAAQDAESKHRGITAASWELEGAEYRTHLTAEANHFVSQPLIWGIEKVVATIGQEAEKIMRGAKYHSEHIARIEDRITNRAEGIKIGKNLETAETIERIESDFYMIEAGIETEGKGRYKQRYIKCMFLFNGAVYQQRFRVGDNNFISNYEINLLTDRKASTPDDSVQVHLFAGNLSNEQIAKAAHAQDCLRAAYKALLTPAETTAAAA